MNKKDDVMNNNNIFDDQLVWLFKFYQTPGDGIVTLCRVIANQLNLLTLNETKWTWNYVHQILNKKMTPSKIFVRTVIRLYSRESKKENIEFEQIIVVAPKGYIEKNSVVNVESKKCANPECQKYFIPSNPVQKYCSSTCKKNYYRRKQCQ